MIWWLICAHQVRSGDTIIIAAGDHPCRVESAMPGTYNRQPCIRIVTAGLSRVEHYLSPTHTVFCMPRSNEDG